MLIIMRNDATDEDIGRVVQTIESLGFHARSIPGRQRTAIGIVGNEGPLDRALFQGLPGVRDVIAVTRPYKLASREWNPEDTLVRVGDAVFGGGSVPVIAGPCSVESSEQILAIARSVRSAGASMLRGGAFKPRTSPYSFQGLGTEGLRLLAMAGREVGLPVVTEAMDPESVEAVAEHADMIQVGSRNMQNYSLLRTVGRAGKPVLLKRGMSATATELLLSAEYILAEGNRNVVLCERGVRGFDPASRNLMDLTLVPVVHQLSHLPVIVDPSHGTGNSELVRPMARAAVAAGADGLMLEVHHEPHRALSDGAQSLRPDEFARLMSELRTLAESLERDLAPQPVEA